MATTCASRLSFSFSSFEGKYHLVIMRMREGGEEEKSFAPLGHLGKSRTRLALEMPPTFHNERFMSGAFGTTLLGYCESARVQCG